MNTNTGSTGSTRRAERRSGNPKAMTRAEAVAAIAATNDPERIEALSTHPNKRVKRYAGYKLDALSGGIQLQQVQAVGLLLRIVFNGVTSPTTFKRRMAAHRAAETRRQKEASNAG